MALFGISRIGRPGHLRQREALQHWQPLEMALGHLQPKAGGLDGGNAGLRNINDGPLRHKPPKYKVSPRGLGLAPKYKAGGGGFMVVGGL